MKHIKLFDLKVVKEKNLQYSADTKRITCPKDAYDFLNECLEVEELAEENFYVITLDTKNNITGVSLVSKGSLNASIVHPREVFKRALLANASNIIISHNHPSGDCNPSKEDISITQRLKECGKLLGIEVLDHLIIGNGYLSFKDKGIL